MCAFLLYRYCGYVPQFKYQIGQTFGNHTHQLLTDPQVPSSSRPVLSDTSPQRPPPLSAKTKEDFFASPLYQQRQRSLGDQKYVAQMVPGYTGRSLTCTHTHQHTHTQLYIAS